MYKPKLPRTNKYMKINKTKSYIYLLGIIVPSIILTAYSANAITGYFNTYGVQILRHMFPNESITLTTVPFYSLSTLQVMDLSIPRPTQSFVLWNLIVTGIILLITLSCKQRQHPVCIYLDFNLILHLIVCVYFLVKPNGFPYDGLQYSALYSRGMMDIMIGFIFMYGLTTAFLGDYGYHHKIFGFLALVSYVIAFGFVRYVVFFAILKKFSTLYMPLMFLAFGPMLDFMYFVSIYSLLVQRLTRIYNKKGSEAWAWF